MTLTPDDPSDETDGEYITFAEITEAIRDEHYDILCPDTIEHRIREEDGNPEDTQRRIREEHGWYYVPKLRLKNPLITGAIIGTAIGTGVGIAYSLFFEEKPQYSTILQCMIAG